MTVTAVAGDVTMEARGPAVANKGAAGAVQRSSRHKT